jgi:hypothetical protein
VPRLLRLTPGLLTQADRVGHSYPGQLRGSVSLWQQKHIVRFATSLLNVDYQRYLKPKTNEFTVYGRYTYPRTSELGWTMLLTTDGSKAKSYTRNGS